jgi:hypothetical protein
MVVVERCDRLDRIHHGDGFILDHSQTVAVLRFAARRKIGRARENRRTLSVKINDNELVVTVHAWSAAEFLLERRRDILL